MPSLSSPTTTLCFALLNLGTYHTLRFAPSRPVPAAPSLDRNLRPDDAVSSNSNTIITTTTSSPPLLSSYTQRSRCISSTAPPPCKSELDRLLVLMTIPATPDTDMGDMPHMTFFHPFHPFHPLLHASSCLSPILSCVSRDSRRATPDRTLSPQPWTVFHH